MNQEDNSSIEALISAMRSAGVAECTINPFGEIHLIGVEGFVSVPSDRVIEFINGNPEARQKISAQFARERRLAEIDACIKKFEAERKELLESEANA